MSQEELFHCITGFVVMYLQSRTRNEHVWEWSTTGRGPQKDWGVLTLEDPQNSTGQALEEPDLGRPAFSWPIQSLEILLKPSYSDSAMAYLPLLFHRPRQLRALLLQVIHLQWHCGHFGSCPWCWRRIRGWLHSFKLDSTGVIQHLTQNSAGSRSGSLNKERLWNLLLLNITKPFPKLNR